MLVRDFFATTKKVLMAVRVVGPVAHLVLYEPWVPTGFEQVGGVGASEGVQVKPVGQAQFLVVPPHASDQRRHADQATAFAGEQVKDAGFTAAVGEPVLQDARCPSTDGEHAAWLGW